MGRTGIYEKILRPARSRQEANDQAQSDQTDDAIGSLNALLSGAALEEEMLEGNTWNLTTGTYGAVRHDKPHGLINAISGGAVLTRACRFTSSAVVDGVTFTDTDGTTSPHLVRLDVAASVLFRGCTFLRSAAEVSHVHVTSGCVAVFTGCVFRGPGGGSVVIQNDAPAASVQLVAGFNYTGNPLGGVTAHSSMVTI